MLAPRITIAITEEPLLAAALQTRLGFPLHTPETPCDFMLTYQNQSLSLVQATDIQHPFYIDFLSGPVAYRSKHTSLKRETLARALGLKSGQTTRIIDATAGLARDSFILASLGFTVTLLERSPLLHALLEDALKRAESVIPDIIQRMHLIHADAITWLPTLLDQDKPELIYLDPMFPERDKTALVKKNMRLLHTLLPEQTDDQALWQAAITCATRRVVVKRPRLANPLANREPSFSMKGSASRFDIYLQANLLNVKA